MGIYSAVFHLYFSLFIKQIIKIQSNTAAERDVVQRRLSLPAMVFSSIHVVKSMVAHSVM